MTLKPAQPKPELLERAQSLPSKIPYDLLEEAGYYKSSEN